MTAPTLRELDGLKYDFSTSATARKIELLAELESSRLTSAPDVEQLHSLLKFSRAFPESRAILTVVERMLEGFENRADLRKHRRALADTGIAGTTLNFRFYWLTAIWLWHRCAPQLAIDWREWENREKLEELLHLLLPFTETPALDSVGYSSREWVDSLRCPDESDAEFVIRRFETLRVPVPMREKLYEDLDIPIILSPGPRTPAKGREKWEHAPVVFQEQAPDRRRPDLKKALKAEKFKVRHVDAREGRQLLDLANFCMVSRHRDLLVFLYGDPHDVRMIDFGDGLQFACFGAIPERRLMLESVYGLLTLMNGVPIGYVLCSAFFESAEVAYNVFDTYRGAGAAHVYSRVLAMIHQLFGVTSFGADPYQLGHDNAEGQESGAWWFYYKLGFRPHDRAILELVREEKAKLKAERGYRTPPGRLHDMAADYMFLQTGRRRNDVLGKIDIGNIGLAVSRYLAERFGAERERGLQTCADETAHLLGQRSWRKLPTGERIAWERWAPLVLALPGVETWSTSQKSALRDVIRAKGGPRESDFVRLFDRHKRLRAAIIELSS